MDVILAKVLSMISILLFSLIFGIAPVILKKCVRSPKVQWINNAVICFSGGTLLGISFLHLMPEMRDSVHKLKGQGYFTSFSNQLSIADTLICAGFFFIYILDELIHMLLEYVGADHAHQPHGRRVALGDSFTFNPRRDSIKSTKDESTSTDNEEVVTSKLGHIPGLLTIMALSFHDIFEGLALGIQEHNMDVLFMFLAIATHKYAIAFSVSLDFVMSKVETKMIILYTVVFSLVNPVGIALGILMSLFNSEEHIESPTTVLMQGIASGSLIYVTCFEVLQRHTLGNGISHGSGIRNTIFVIIGFLFTLLMKVYLPHKHFHS